MAKIKIKDIEGNADEIKNLFKDLGCDLNSYLNTSPLKKKIPTFWIFIIAPLFFILCCLVWCNLFNPNWTKVCILALFLFLGTIVFIIHHNHEKWTITLISMVTGLCLILISLNVYTPQELAKRLEDNTIEKVNKK